MAVLRPPVRSALDILFQSLRLFAVVHIWFHLALASFSAWFGSFSVKVGMQKFDDETGFGQSDSGRNLQGPVLDDLHGEPLDETDATHDVSRAFLFDPGDGDGSDFDFNAGGIEFGPAESFSCVDFSGAFSQGNQTTPEVSQPVMSAAVHDAIFAKSLFSNVDVTGIKLPWEVGVFRDLFSDEPVVETLVPKMPINDFCCFDVGVAPQQVAETVARVASHVDSHPVFEKCVSSGDELHYEEKRQKLRDAAVGKLLIVINHNLDVSATGKHIKQLSGDGDVQGESADIVSSVVGVKSPATIVKRANSLLAFIRWCHWTGKDADNFFQESFIWEYFQYLKSSSAPASKADSMMSALRFAFYVLGFECLSCAVASRRLVGASDLMLAGKRLLRQALVLSVPQVKRLHSILADSERHLMDRVLAVHILFALYGRCRHSDLLDIHAMEFDLDSKGGFVILSTCSHKTGRVAALKTRLMPIVIPARGVDGSIWPVQALDVLKSAGGFKANPINGPLVHAPAGGIGAFMNRGLRSTEVSRALRCFLGLPEPTPGCNDEIVSSHSLKATLLSWAARFGLTPQTRSLLGRHTSCLNETFAIYSRDLTCAPVAELQKLIDSVASGAFDPDGERTKFFMEPGLRATPCEQPQMKKEVSDCGSYILIHDSPVDSVDAPEADDVSGFEDGHVEGVSEDGVTATVQDAGNQVVDVQDEFESDSGSSSGESSGSSSDASELGAVQHRVKRFRARIPVDEEWYVHRKSHLVHRFDGNRHNDVRFLVCGKLLTDAYSSCTEATAWNTLCKSCNRK